VSAGFVSGFASVAVVLASALLAEKINGAPINVWARIVLSVGGMTSAWVMLAGKVTL
jgi:hypothetical protein